MTEFTTEKISCRGVQRGPSGDIQEALTPVTAVDVVLVTFADRVGNIHQVPNCTLTSHGECHAAPNEGRRHEDCPRKKMISKTQ